FIRELPEMTIEDLITQFKPIAQQMMDGIRAFLYRIEAWPEGTLDSLCRLMAFEERPDVSTDNPKELLRKLPTPIIEHFATKAPSESGVGKLFGIEHIFRQGHMAADWECTRNGNKLDIVLHPKTELKFIRLDMRLGPDKVESETMETEEVKDA